MSKNPMDDKINRVRVTVVMADGTVRKEDRFLLREHPLNIFVNDKPVYQLVCTRDHIRELVAGRLCTDRLIRSTDDIREISISQDETEARVLLNDVNPDAACSLQADCTDKTAPLTKSEELIKKEWIFRLAGLFKEDAPIHQLTLSTHSCILAREGSILFSCEDIGRHNVIDKTAGYALFHGIDLSECILYISGRVPVDMTEKVLAAGIPVLVTKASPTAESVALAKKHGLTIISRAYPDQFEIIE